jgi:caffeoyl-CoA O-methyltransferase
MNFTQKDIENYCISHSSPVSSIADDLQRFTMDSVHGSQMLVGKLEAAVLQFLIKLADVKNILELGTYTGYSALIMAEALPQDGKVTTIDINPETTSIAKKYWEQSVHGKKIQSLLGSGPEVLNNIHSQFDLIFIDADKNNYPTYLKWALNHLSKTGIIITDNTLWSGKVLEKATTEDQIDKQTASIQEHNEIAKKLEGYQKVLLPIRDGMYLIKPNC